ncbi:MAG: regulatory signaling modulator protein AmpE [Shewanellaceae bacterium]|nr:regulatory signaling modulator protein AmpE [Shewanellaceae bacterium]
MTLFTLIIVAFLSRFVLFLKPFSWESLLYKVKTSFFNESPLDHAIVFWMFLISPNIIVLLLQFLVYGVFGGIFSLLLWLCVTWLCFNQISHIRSIEDYLETVESGDDKKAALQLEALRQAFPNKNEHYESIGHEIGHLMIWEHYQKVIVLIFYLMLLGPAAMSLYTTFLFLQRYFFEKGIEHPVLEQVIFLCDWIPCRIISTLYLIIGNFSKASTQWLIQLPDLTLEAKNFVCQVATAATFSKDELQKETTQEITAAYLDLKKRTIIMTLVCLSLLTMTGLVN